MIKTAFLPIIDENAKILILGTMSSDASLEKREYYGHSKNQFWKIIYALFEQAFEQDYQSRKAFLCKHRIALWDVLSHCERKGSADAAIKEESANDFRALYQKYPNIKNVFFTSGDAEKYYKKHVGENGSLTFYRLPSPSPAHASKSFEYKLRAWTQLLDFL